MLPVLVVMLCCYFDVVVTGSVHCSLCNCSQSHTLDIVHSTCSRFHSCTVFLLQFSDTAKVLCCSLKDLHGNMMVVLTLQCKLRERSKLITMLIKTKTETSLRKKL